MAGKGTNKKTTLYVGGLEENVNEATLHSAFIPFGDIKDVNIPMDNTTGKHRGFGFVEYESAEVGSYTFSFCLITPSALSQMIWKAACTPYMQ